MVETNGLHHSEEQELDTLSREGLEKAIADYNDDVQVRLLSVVSIALYKCVITRGSD